jgi:hypothetical protein
MAQIRQKINVILLLFRQSKTVEGAIQSIWLRREIFESYRGIKVAGERRSAA